MRQGSEPEGANHGGACVNHGASLCRGLCRGRPERKPRRRPGGSTPRLASRRGNTAAAASQRQDPAVLGKSLLHLPRPYPV